MVSIKKKKDANYYQLSSMNKAVNCENCSLSMSSIQIGNIYTL